MRFRSRARLSSVIRVDGNEAVEHALAAGLFEVDLQLVAFDLGDGAVAEFAVEDAGAESHVGAAGIAEADRAGARFHDAGRHALKAAGGGALPAGPASGG